MHSLSAQFKNLSHNLKNALSLKKKRSTDSSNGSNNGDMNVDVYSTGGDNDNFSSESLSARQFASALGISVLLTDAEEEEAAAAAAAAVAADLDQEEAGYYATTTTSLTTQQSQNNFFLSGNAYSNTTISSITSFSSSPSRSFSSYQKLDMNMFIPPHNINSNSPATPTTPTTPAIVIDNSQLQDGKHFLQDHSFLPVPRTLTSTSTATTSVYSSANSVKSNNEVEEGLSPNYLPHHLQFPILHRHASRQRRASDISSLSSSYTRTLERFQETEEGGSEEPLDFRRQTLSLDRKSTFSNNTNANGAVIRKRGRFVVKVEKSSYYFAASAMPKRQSSRFSLVDDESSGSSKAFMDKPE